MFDTIKTFDIKDMAGLFAVLNAGVCAKITGQPAEHFLSDDVVVEYEKMLRQNVGR
jgi:hypothetical protein